jgi:hypothetical protein
MRKTSSLEIIKKAVAEFNRYRSPEATARLKSGSRRSFKIEFSGPFCRTCGFHDYFDDFRLFLEELGLKAEIADVQEAGERAAVKFKIK